MPIKYNKDIKTLLFKYRELEVARDELLAANTELAFQNSEKEKRAAELVIANAELLYQNSEKEKRAAELVIANKELFFQNSEKEKRAAELVIANAELVYQNSEKEMRAAELVIANAELVFQNSEKEKRAAELVIANAELLFQNAETKRRVAEINNLAFYDSLTMLPNRRLLVDRLKQALATSARAGHHGALLYLDIDHFKTLNDTYGHNAGNLLLQQVSSRLVACVREGDTVARLGGDEFVLILEALGANKIAAAAYARVIASKIMDALNLPYQLETQPYSCTSSVGVTLFSKAKIDPEALLQQADIAM
ncbi:MAG: diguanylate cyclase, partial [Nitrosomonadales bacterium]|nr:diguanylate cyclase [Nitrosomonadales bacterium]